MFIQLCLFWTIVGALFGSFIGYLMKGRPLLGFWMGVIFGPMFSWIFILVCDDYRKRCPACRKTVDHLASVCPFCRSVIDAPAAPPVSR